MKLPTIHNKVASGFTLLELLVVLIIFAVLTGTLVLGFSGADEEQALRGLAERISARVELARQYALQRNREWGIFVEPDTYRFMELDPQRGRWVEQAYRPFVSEGRTARIAFRVETEGFDQGQFGVSEEASPDIIVFSNGEVTPFQWYLEPAWQALPWLVRSDGISPSVIERDLDRL